MWIVQLFVEMVAHKAVSVTASVVEAQPTLCIIPRCVASVVLPTVAFAALCGKCLGACLFSEVVGGGSALGLPSCFLPPNKPLVNTSHVFVV